MTFNMSAGNTIELQSGFTLSVQTVKFTSWGTNCPATTVSAPYTWIRVIVPDGSVCYIPAYK